MRTARTGIVHALVALLVLLGTGSALAAERDFTLRFSANVNGQITIVGNTAMQCPLGTVDPLLNSGCSAAQTGTGTRNNNSFDMQWLDVDADPATFISSSATLTIPSGGRVLFAGLYWTGVQKKGEVIKGANGFVGVPQGPPNAAAIGTVKLKAPGASTYTTIAASQVDTAPIAVSSGFGAFADVTAEVASAGSGSYTVADIQTGTGGNIAAGWSLVVAYADPAEALRNLSVFDGLRIVSGQQTVSIPVSGFKTPSSGPVRSAIGVVAAEGDAGTTGDYLTLEEQLLTDAVHPPNNTENSSIAHFGTRFTAKSPDWRNQLGYDSSLFATDGILANGATKAMFRAKTNGDTYAPQAITFATELFSPNVTLTKTVTEVNNGNSAPGSTLEYTITATNNGAADALDVELVDPIPAGTTFVNGSASISAGTGNVTASPVNGAIIARLGTNASASAGGVLNPIGSSPSTATASVTFRVTIDGDRPLGDVIDNVATLEFTAPDLGLPVSTVASASTVVNYADPGVSKQLVSSSPPSYTYRIDVTNEGSLATSGTLSIDDAIPGATGAVTAITATNWTCASATAFPCESTQTVAPGDQYSPILVTVNYSSSPVGNTAYLDLPGGGAVGGGGQPTAGGSPARLNDSSIVTVGQLPTASLRLSKAALTGTVDVGSLAGFRLTVVNQGPAAATNAVVTDTLPAGLTYDAAASSTSRGSCSSAAGPAGTTIVTCALGTLGVGEEARITLRARVGQSLAGEQDVENTASATSDLTTSPATDLAVVDVRPATNLRVEKIASATTVDQGNPLSYVITATNDGPAAAVRMQIVDRLPAAFDTSQTITMNPSDSGTCSLANGIVQCLWAVDVPAGEVRTVSIAGTLKSSVPVAERRMLNRVNVFSRTTELDPADNYDEAVTTVIPAADLAAGASGPMTIPADGDGSLTFTSTNNGPSTSTGTTLTATIPDGLTAVVVPAGCTISGQVVTCDTGTIPVGETVTREIEVRAANLEEAPRDAEVVVASTGTPDPIPENDADTTPFVAGPVAALSITKVADVTRVRPGGTVTYTLTVANAGPASSTGAYVIDELPAGMSVQSATSSIPEGCTVTGREVRCEAGEIVPGASFQVLIVAVVDRSRSGATLVNTATLTRGPQRDPDQADNTASATVRVDVVSRARLRITTRVAPTSAYPKVRVRISATVRNVSSVAANSVTTCITIPTRVRYVSSKGTRRGSLVCFTRAQLKSGRSFTVSFLAMTRTPGAARPRGTARAGNAATVRSTAKLQIRRPGGGGGGVTG